MIECHLPCKLKEECRLRMKLWRETWVIRRKACGRHALDFAPGGKLFEERSLPVVETLSREDFDRIDGLLKPDEHWRIQMTVGDPVYVYFRSEEERDCVFSLLKEVKDA